MSQPKVRSTTQRLGNTWKPGTPASRWTTSNTSGGMLRLNPGGELGAVEAAVHPQFEQFRIIGQDRGQQGSGSFAFGAVGGFERDAEQQSQGVHQQETLATLGFLGGIVADFPAVGAGAHGLTGEAGGGGLRVLASGLPHFGAEAVIEPGQQTRAGPLAEMVIDGLPRREVFGEEPPLGTGLDQIKDGVEDVTQGGARATAFFGGGQEAAKQVPLGVGEIGFVRGDFHRLKSAAANESRQNSPSNQGICASFFFKQALTVVACFSSWMTVLVKLADRPPATLSTPESMVSGRRGAF